MMNPKIQELKLAVNFIKEGKSIVAYSPALDISTAGKDKREARKNFEEMVSMFFEDIIERNTIKDVLSDLGWKKKSKIANKQNPMSGWVQPNISQGVIPVQIPQVN
jgi:predicted RNase H-like HicB family nuclease